MPAFAQGTALQVLQLTRLSLAQAKCPQSSKRLSGASYQQRALEQCKTIRFGKGKIICSMGRLSGFSFELRDEYKAEADVVVAIVGGVVVPVSQMAVLRIVVPSRGTRFVPIIFLMNVNSESYFSRYLLYQAG